MDGHGNYAVDVKRGEITRGRIWPGVPSVKLGLQLPYAFDDALPLANWKAFHA